MLFIRRDMRPARRFVALRVGLFFFAAGLWFAGVRIGSGWVTAAAMAIAVVAVLLGLLIRRREEREGEDMRERD